MLQQYILVDEEGFQIDVLLLNPNEDEITEFHVSEISEGLFTPKWNFETLSWEEGLSEEEVEKRRKEIKEQMEEVSIIDKLTMENEVLKKKQEMLEGALIEMAQMLF